MKKLFTLLLVAIVVNNVYSQNYDLIVKTNGDSIACHIDSINDSQIYFEMKVQNHWIHTNIDRNEVVDYKYTAIDKKTNVFKPGTSFIESSGKEPTSLRDIQRNSIAFETNIANYSLYYGRLFPLGNIAGITVGAAYNYFVFDVTYITVESTILLGQTKHFFEPGLFYYYAKKDDSGSYLKFGYRFQGLNGFLFRAYVGFALSQDEEIWVIPMIGVGYSF